MAKNKKRKIETMTIKVDVSKLKIFDTGEEYRQHIDNIKWGNGIHKPKKGKGSYTRKQKYKKY